MLHIYIYILYLPSVNIKDILQVQVGFNCLLSLKGIMLLMLPLTCKGLVGINSLLLIYINTLWLDVYVSSHAFVIYGLGYMLDIPHGIR